MNKIVKKLFILVLFLGLFFINIPSANAAIIPLPNQNQAPKMITMSLYDDYKSMAFNYNTAWDTDTILQVVLDGEDFSGENIKEYVGTTEKSKVLNDGFIHKVVATNLEANMKYLYRLGDKELNNWSDVGSFTTANNSDSLRFIHISDPQGYEEIHYDNYNELLTIAVANSNPNFILLTGDVVNASYKDAAPNLQQWHWALTDQKEILQNIPIMAVAGNHDEASYDFVSRFNNKLALDSDTVSGTYYSFDYNNVHFVALNTNDTIKELDSLRGLSTAQIYWLENDLEKNKSKFTIVMMHKGIYDAGGHCSNMDGEDADIALIREQLTPIFAKYKVDLVLQGHDHLYSRSYPIIGNSGPEFKPLVDNSVIKEEVLYNDLIFDMYNNPNGTIYLNSGTASGSKYYAPVNYDSEMIPIEVADGSNDRMYTEFVIEGDKLYATVYKLNNKRLTVFDTFAISKDSSQLDTNLGTESGSDELIEHNYTIYIILGAILLILLIAYPFVIKFIKKKRGGNR